VVSLKKSFIYSFLAALLSVSVIGCSSGQAPASTTNQTSQAEQSATGNESAATTTEQPSASSATTSQPAAATTSAPTDQTNATTTPPANQSTAATPAAPTQPATNTTETTPAAPAQPAPKTTASTPAAAPSAPAKPATNTTANTTTNTAASKPASTTSTPAQTQPATTATATPAKQEAKKTPFKAYLEGLEKRFIPENAKGVSVVYQFVITDGNPGKYYVIISDGTIKTGEGTAENPSVTITVGEQLWLDIAADKVNGTMAYLTGKFSIDGDTDHVSNLKTYFKKQ
jgi:putative sterol carrier protein